MISINYGFLVRLWSDGDSIPLTQPQPSHGTLGGSCPGTPEMKRRQEEAMRRLASQVNKNAHTWFTNILL